MGFSRWFAAASTVVAIGAMSTTGGVPVAAAPPTAKVYVSNVNGDSVGVIDVATNTILTTITVGNEPRNLAVTPNGDTVYVPNRFSNSVSVISTTTDTVTTTITDIGFDDPYAVAVSPDGARAWVANKTAGTSTGSVTVIDTATNTVSGTINSECFASPEGILATAATVYVVNRGGDNVCPIDAVANTVGSAIAVGSAPRFAVISPDGTTLYVSNESGTVSKIDTATNAVLATITTGGSPRNMAITADGSKIYVPLLTGSVAIVATATDTATTLPLAGATKLYGVAIAQVEGLAYITDETAGAVWVIAIATDLVVPAAGLATGFATPRAAVAVSAATTTVPPTTVPPTTAAPTTAAPTTSDLGAQPALPATGGSTSALLLALAVAAIGAGILTVRVAARH